MAKDYNYVKKLFMQKCSVTDVSILIETAFEAAIPTLYNISEYTCGDIMKMRGGHTWGAAAKAFRGIGTKKRRSTARRRGQCGRTLFNEGGTPKAFGGVQIDQFKFLYEVTGTAFVEGALFKFFLFEVGKDFLINWMTLAYAAEQCSLPPSGTIYTTWSALCSVPGPNDVVCTIGPGSTHCASCIGTEIHVEAGCQATISWAGEWEAFFKRPGNMGNVTMYLEDDRGKVWDSTTPILKPGATSLTQGGGAYNLPGAFPLGTTYRLKAKIHAGLMCPVDAAPCTLTINTAGRPVHFNPMNGCGKALGRANDEIWGWIDEKLSLDRFAQPIPNPWFDSERGA